MRRQSSGAGGGAVGQISQMMGWHIQYALATAELATSRSKSQEEKNSVHPPRILQPAEPDLEELAASGIFDGAWYLLQNSDVCQAGLDPWDHFSRFGWHEGRHPNRYFDLLGT